MKYEASCSRYGWAQQYNHFFDGLELFRYEPLKADTSIRLLKLSPASTRRRHLPKLMRNRSQGFINNALYDKDRFSKLDWFKRPYKNISLDELPFQPLVVTLEEFDLEEAPSYAAISYTWGPADERALICNDRLMYVSRNAALALYHALHAQTSRNEVYIWIDQICIEQSNLDEKGQQVSHMGEIYTQAKVTYAWIGSTSPEQEASILEVVQDRNFSFNNTIYDQPWFTRGWIVQEMWLSKAIIVLCGQWIMPWSLVNQTFDTETTAAIVTGLRKEKNPRARFGGTMQLMLRTKVSQPLDRFYAFCGVNPDLEELVGSPDYNMDPEDLAQRFFRNLVTKEGPDGEWLWMWICVTAKRSDASDLEPSWYPDMTNLCPTLSACLNLGQLKAFDSLGWVSDTWDGNAGSNEPELTAQAAKPLECRFVEVGTIQKSLWPTMQGLFYNFDSKATEIAQRLQRLHRNIHYEKEKVLSGRPADFRHVVRDSFKHGSEPREDAILHARTQVFEAEIKFKRLKDGISVGLLDHSIEVLAITDRETQVGDTIVLFKGLSVRGPFSVIRPHADGTWKYIGACHIMKIDLDFLYEKIFNILETKTLVLT